MTGPGHDISPLLFCVNSLVSDTNGYTDEEIVETLTALIVMLTARRDEIANKANP